MTDEELNKAEHNGDVFALRREIERLLNVIRYIDENGESDGGDAMAEYARRALEHKP